MTGEGIQKVLLYGEVLHNLRRQFHEIPVHVGSAHALEASIGKHAVQCVTELMKECINLRESQQRRLFCRRLREIHRNRNMRAAVGSVTFYPLLFIACHPCSRAFSGTRMEVGIEHSQIASVFIEHLVRLYVGVIYRNLLILFERDAIESCS